VAGARDDLQARLPAKEGLGDAVEADDVGIVASDDEQRRRARARKRLAREVRAAAS